MVDLDLCSRESMSGEDLYNEWRDILLGKGIEYDYWSDIPDSEKEAWEKICSRYV